MIESKKALSLKELEAEVLAEGREWTRQRLQQRLQTEAAEAGAAFPPPATPATPPDVTHGGGKSDAGGHLRS